MERQGFRACDRTASYVESSFSWIGAIRLKADTTGGLFHRLVSPAIRRTLFALTLAAPFVLGALTALGAQQNGRVDPAVFSGLRWRSIGPFRAGRVNGVSGVPGQPNVFYAGSVGGGV